MYLQNLSDYICIFLSTALYENWRFLQFASELNDFERATIVFILATRAFPLGSRYCSRSKRESASPSTPHYICLLGALWCRLLHHDHCDLLPPFTFVSRTLCTHRAIRTGMNKGKERLNDTEKKGREREIRSTLGNNNGWSSFHLNGWRLGRNRRDTSPRVHPLETDLSWLVFASVIPPRTHLVSRGPPPPKVVRSCLHMPQSRTLARYDFASAIPGDATLVAKLHGFSDGEAE